MYNFKTKPMKVIFGTILLLCASFILMLYPTGFRKYVYKFNFLVDKKEMGFNANMNGTVTEYSKQKFLVDTDVCRILDVNPFDESIKHLLIRHPEISVCDEREHFTYIHSNTLYINNTRKPKGVTYCRFKPIFVKQQHSFIFGKESVKFVSSIPIEDEFLKIECYNLSDSIIAENFQVHFVPKINSRGKMQNVSPGPASGILNVQLIMLEATSRINSLRYLPQTRKFLLETLGGVEMLGYNKVADNTRVNMVPILTGEFENRLDCFKDIQGVDNCSFIWQKFSQKGYLTHYSEDWSRYSIFHHTRPGFKHQPTDYYDYPFHVAREQSERSMFDVCSQGKLVAELLYNRMYDLTLNLGQTPYFSLLLQIRHTHDILTGLVDIDNITKNTLSKMYEDNLLNNTFLALFGDHGMRFGDVRQTFIGYLEERLPFMVIYVPVWFRRKYKAYFKNLNVNRKRLTTNFDMHSTLLHLLDLNRKTQKHHHGKGISLFDKIPDNRSCKDAGILPHWCTCNFHLSSKVNSTAKHNMALVLVSHINKLLKKFSTKCEKLELMNILSTYKLNFRALRMEKYRIVIRTEPGAAVFESTLKYNGRSHTFSVAGDISRLNMYRDQTDCINNDRIKKLCFCKA